MAKKKNAEVVERVGSDKGGVEDVESKSPTINDEQIAGLSALAPSDDFVPGAEVAEPEQSDSQSGLEKKQALAGLVVVVSGLVESFLPGYGLVDAEVDMLVDPLDAVLDKYCCDLAVGPEAGLGFALVAISAPRVIKYRQQMLVSGKENNQSGVDNGSEPERQSH